MSALREIVARFGVSFDTAELKKGTAALEDVIGSLKGFAGALGIGLTLGALREFTVAAVDQVVALDKQARYLRVGGEELQRWQQSAQIAGVSAEAMNGALETMRLRSRKPAEALMQVADKLEAIKDPTRRAMMGTAMFGNSYRELEPLLEKGRKGIKAVMSEAEDLAGVFDKDTVAAAKSARQEIGKLSVFFGGLRTQLAATVLPVFTELMNKFLVPAAVAFRRLTANGMLFKAITLSLATGGVFKLIAAFGGLTKMLGLLTRQFLTIVAPILILEDFLVFLAGGKSAMGDVMDRLFGKGTQEKVRAWIQTTIPQVEEFFKEIVKPALQFFTDTKAAWTDFKAGVQLIWFDLLTYIKESWLGFGILATITSTVEGIKLAIRGISAVASAVGTVLSGMWDGFTWGLKKAIEGVEKLTKLPGFKQIAEAAIKVFGGPILAGAAGAVQVGGAAYDQLKDGPPKNSAALADERQRIIDSSVSQDRPTAATSAAAGASTTTIKVENSPKVTVQLPQGTPEQTGNRIAAATQKALQQSNAGDYAAAVPGRS